MIKKKIKFTITILILASCSSLLMAKTVTRNEIKKTFDSENGWWWYQEEVIDEDNKTKEIKYKVSASAKKKIEAEKETQELLKMMIKIQLENVALNTEIKDRLNYAFPDTTPKYTKNKKTGEKCLTNSSMDCFVMPVIAEGQNIPALKEFLKNPNPENSKNWLQWQATYFNHINDVSHGLRFAFLKDGAKAYPTETSYTYGDNLFNPKSLDMKATRETKIIKSMKKEIAYLIFVGSSKIMEESSSLFSDLASLNNGFMKKMNKALIFPNKEILASMDKYVEDVILGEEKKFTVYNAWKDTKKTVRKDLYARYNVSLTPTTIIYYRSKDMEEPKVQTIEVGNISMSSIKNGTIDFLKYHGIIKPSDLSADKNWNVLEESTEFNKNTVKLPKAKKPQKFQGVAK